MNNLIFKGFATLLILNMIHAGQLFGQQRIIEKTFSADAEETVRLNLKFGENITIRGWDKNEISFKAIVEINSGKLNDALLVDYFDDRNGIRIDTGYDKEKLKEGRCEDCPGNHYSMYNWNDNGNGYVVCSHIVYEIYVPRRADLELETISADVELFNLTGPIDAKSISGFVDLSWPEKQGADLSIKTVTGEAYTNLGNLNFKNRKEHVPLVGYELRGSVGQGGPFVRLESVSGDVYLRKE